MNELLEKYITEMDEKINRTMKQYNLTEADVSMGGASLIRGWIMGMREAVNIAKKMASENSVTEAADETQQKKSRTRRSRGE